MIADMYEVISGGGLLHEVEMTFLRCKIGKILLV